ncbi:tail fiber domain-containing protein [Sinomonas sp. JGH33]|uniref:Tail fiber domain-containing protein n=1 Tax=Sinomonas terricola TaxID=3110330 RepID=A0ABU5T4J1_9MICC|nr:tail fiber domain-containing protein [Sinomonas sp. JGH33]MEA5454467.1 tail fiber domain-containing protein [Sinomonas sp. JGH33]
MADLIPRSIPDPDPEARFWDQQAEAKKEVERLQRGAPQRSMSISDTTGAGIRADTTGFYTVDATGHTIGILQTSDGTFVVYDPASNQPRARFGKLLSDGSYGGEIWDTVNGVWVKLVTGSSVSWAAITGKPSTFPPSSHTHPGADVTSAVADATGSSWGYNNNVGGTSYFAMWQGNDLKFGKNTSSIRYKENAREHWIDPARVLALLPVLYERINGGLTEFGLIAEQVAEHLPELVQWYDGRIESVRYDLLAVALLGLLRHQEERLGALEAAMQQVLPAFAPPAAAWTAAPSTACNNPPEVIPAPDPYTIAPQQGGTA